MAEAIGLGASILSIAAFGATVVTTLRIFATSYSSADQKIKDLSGDVALTASILTDLGNTVKEYEVEFRLKADNFSRAEAACERNFETLRKALREARKNDSPKQANERDIKNTDSDKKLPKKQDGMRAWDKLKFALGGEEHLKELVFSIETTKSNLQLLLDSVNLLVLKKLSKKHLLNEEQAEDLNLLVQHLPALMMSLRNAELVNWGLKHQPPDNPPGVEALGTERGMPQTVFTATESKAEEQKLVPEEVAKTSENTKERVVFESSAQVQEAGVIERVQQEHRSDPPLRKKDRSTLKPHQSALEQRSSPEPLSLYEGWLLEKDEGDVAEPTIFVLCGLKMRVYYPPEEGSYEVSPFSRDQERLKRHVDDFESESGASGAASRIALLFEGLSREGRSAINSLLGDRNQYASDPFEWRIAGIIDVTKHKLRQPSFWRDKNLVMKPPRWLIVLKGGVFAFKDKVLINLPDRYDDPFAEQRRIEARESTSEVKYRERLETDLRKSGVDERQIAVVTKKDKEYVTDNPTWTRMSRKYLSIETLNRYRIDYEIDTDPDFVLIKREVPEYEQDYLWSHTKQIRERRRPLLVSIESKKKHHHHGDVEFEFVRKKEYKGKPEPSPLLTFLAGGTRSGRSSKNRPESTESVSRHSTIGSCGSYEEEIIVRENAREKPERQIPQEEAEKLMDEFLATFTEETSDSDDGKSLVDD